MNPVNNCIACAATDDHPRHSVYTGHGFADFHVDCHALMDPPCESCLAQLEGVGGARGNPKGDELRKHMQATGSTADKPGWTAPADRNTGV